MKRIVPLLLLLVFTLTSCGILTTMPVDHTAFDHAGQDFVHALEQYRVVAEFDQDLHLIFGEVAPRDAGSAETPEDILRKLVKATHWESHVRADGVTQIAIKPKAMPDSFIWLKATGHNVLILWGEGEGSLYWVQDHVPGWAD